MALEKPVDHQSVSHPSHIHPLLNVTKIQDKYDEIICSGCELDLTGQAFKCTEEDCDYFIHKSCFDLPREVKHKSHPEHPLTLLHSSPYGDSFECSGCGETGSGFTYNCSDCEYDLHVGCVVLPETVEREDHEHPLTLLYKNPCKDDEEDVRFICSTCEGYVSDDHWVYYCKECDYGTHVYKQSCEASELNSLIQANFLMMRGMQLQARSNALTISLINARR